MSDSADGWRLRAIAKQDVLERLWRDSNRAMQGMLNPYLGLGAAGGGCAAQNLLQPGPFKDVAAPQAMIYSLGDDAAQDSGQWSTEQIAAIKAEVSTIDPHVINRLPAPQAVIQKPTGVFTVCVSVNGTPIVQSPEPPEEGLMQSDAKAVKEWREKRENPAGWTVIGTWTPQEPDPGRGLGTVAPMGHRLGGWGLIA